MRIAVVVNNYNYARFLDECLRSVFAQARAPDEIVVVDDGSTDDSVARLEAIAATAPIPVKIVAKRNGGQLSAFRAGLAATTCDVLCLLDADDRHAPAHVAAVERAFAADPGTQVLFHAYTREFADGSLRPHRLADAVMPGQSLETVYLQRYCGGPTSTISLRREAFARVLEGADEAEYRISADAVLVLKAAALGLARRTAAANTVVYRIHGANLFAGRRISGQARRRVRARYARLLSHERAALDALSADERLQVFLQELAAAPRSPVAVYRFARLLAAVPAPVRVRLGMVRAYLAWLATGGNS